MNKVLIFPVAALFCVGSLFGQSDAERRASRMGVGMNLSYLDNYWKGTKEKHFSDFAKPEEAAKREKMLADIAKAGFKTVRIPICFSAWMEIKQPYDWDNPDALKMPDSFVKWALDSGLNVIIDLHHSEFDRSVADADDPERIVNLWTKIAERYKNTDPERVFFELRNEPNKIPAEQWRWQAEQIIKYVRAIAPKHTLIVGFHEWNGRQQLIESKPFADPNIIYTFHYYDPFVFTHQGATWAGPALKDLRSVPFPYSADDKIKVPDSAKGSYIEQQIGNYKKESDPEKMYADLKAAKDWAIKNKVPVFVGEFGSYDQYSSMEDRCRHATAVYSALGKLGLPNAWWEWDGGFNMFEKGSQTIAPCMRKAIDSFSGR
ncbi:MAG: glycoside hydrolase family 5 protein [Acidobacteriota bacterium]